MLVIGLTGGIGSGKSRVSEYFTNLGVPVLDTDQVARDIVRPGAEALHEIRDRFGDSIIQKDGSLDRRALREIVFADEVARIELESIMHPRIREVVRDWIGRQHHSYCVVVIPLLLEKGWTELIDRILVVDLPESLQTERTMRRDRLSREQVETILATQVSRSQRLSAADDIIVNDADEAFLKQQIDDIHQKYLNIEQEARG
ncbi:MAG: dephospho-CoA kinase [Gammaproteobacteria bacterium]|nr:dephospho-CoA kinase [Gammaproteobacteria bacterium]